MKAMLCLLATALAASVLKADDSPSVDLFAGWSWSPFACSDYPYGYGGYPYGRPVPYAGLAAGLSEDAPAGSAAFGYAPYDWTPYWGLGSGVRIALKPRSVDEPLTLGLLPAPPGTAPVQLRDPQAENRWNSDLQGIFTRTDTDTWRESGTNAPSPVAGHGQPQQSPAAIR